MPKARVRELAREFGLANAEKADSQDICFVPSGHYTEMIERLIPGASVPGEIVHADGRVLGRHGGVVHFTIGQRRGIGVAAAEPLYVVGLDAPNARVIVGPRASLAVARLRLRDVNWIGPGAITASAVARIANCRAGSLDSSAGSRPAHAHGRDRVRRARNRRLARSSLCLLRFRRPGRPGARRRVHRRRLTMETGKHGGVR